jgi:hypothetical protein
MRHPLTAEVQFRQSRGAKAMEEFAAARGEFFRQNLGADEHTVFVAQRINQVMEKLYNVK